MIFESFIFLNLLKFLPFLSFVLDLGLLGFIELFEEHLHQFFVISRRLFMMNDCLHIESAGHNKSFTDHQLYLDSHLSSLNFELALFFEILNEVIAE